MTIYHSLGTAQIVHRLHVDSIEVAEAAHQTQPENLEVNCPSAADLFQQQ